MNTVNKILVVLAVLIAIPVCVGLFLAPIPILNAVQQGVQGLLRTLQGFPTLPRIALGALFSLAWLVVSVLFLVAELRRPPVKTVRVDKVDGGEAEVSLRTVQEHIAFAVDQLPGVLRARAQVSARKGGVAVEVEVDTAGDQEVPARAGQIVEVVREVVEERVGVKLARPPKVRLRATPTPSGPAARAWRESEQREGVVRIAEEEEGGEGEG